LLKIARFRNGPLGVKSLVSTSRILGAPRERAHHSAVASAAPAMRFPLLSPVSCFRPWSAQSRHTMPSEETANLSKDARSESRPLACTRLRWLHRPGDGTSGGATLWRSEFGFFSSGAATPEPNSAFVHRKSVPSTHIRCKITPILRASATLARFNPRRFARHFCTKKAVLNQRTRFCA
jgi:hypothetical protein